MKHRLGNVPSPGFVLGELSLAEQPFQPQARQGPPLDQDLAAEKIWADAQLTEAQMYSDVAVPEGDFSYAPPIHREIDFKKRRPHEWFNTELPPMIAAFNFLGEAQGRVFMDEAIGMVKRLGILLYKRRPDGARSILLESPFKRWVQSDSVVRLVSDFRDVYEAEDNGKLREDNDIYGTNVSLAYCDGRPFVLTVCSKVAQDSTGEQIITRRVVAERVESAETVMNAANQLSLREQLRVKRLLTEWGASKEYSVRVIKLANRRSVQSDADVKRLLAGCDAKETRSQKAIDALHRLTSGIISFTVWQSNADTIVSRPSRDTRKGKHRKSGWNSEQRY